MNEVVDAMLLVSFNERVSLVRTKAMMPRCVLRIREINEHLKGDPKFVM